MDATDANFNFLISQIKSFYYQKEILACARIYSLFPVFFLFFCYTLVLFLNDKLTTLSFCCLLNSMIVPDTASESTQMILKVGRFDCFGFNRPLFQYGWSDGAKMLGKLSVPGRPGQWSIALAVGAGGGCLDFFLLSIIFLFFLPLSGRWPNID